MPPLSSLADRALAPDFHLKDETGQTVTLVSLTSRGPAMLVFYPGDFTPICTRQLCAYQENYEKFAEYGIQLAGISFNDERSHREFKDRYAFGFPLLSDPGKAVFRAYGVTSLFMLGGASRAVIIVSKAGEILYRYVEPTILTRRKPGELLDALEDLRRRKRL